MFCKSHEISLFTMCARLEMCDLKCATFMKMLDFDFTLKDRIQSSNYEKRLLSFSAQDHLTKMLTRLCQGKELCLKYLESITIKTVRLWFVLIFSQSRTFQVAHLKSYMRLLKSHIVKRLIFRGAGLLGFCSYLREDLGKDVGIWRSENLGI